MKNLLKVGELQLHQANMTLSRLAAGKNGFDKQSRYDLWGAVQMLDDATAKLNEIKEREGLL